MKYKILLVAIVLLNSSLLFSSTKFKIGVLAPEGTGWAKNLKKMAREVKLKTSGKVKFKFYFGGSQGDEIDVLRKIRIGQLQGGVFTGKTLGDIDGDLRLLELPFNFTKDRQVAFKTLQSMSSFLSERLARKQFLNLGFFEIGLVYFVSIKKAPDLKTLRSIKIWTWSGDKLVEALISELNLNSVPLSLPDVLGSLTTGIIEGAYAPALGIMALQWNNKVKYLLNIPLAYSIGSLLLSQKAFKKLDTATAFKVKEIVKKYIKNINKVNISDNHKALKILKDSGIEFYTFDKKTLSQLPNIRKKILNKVKNGLFSKEGLKLFNKVYKK